MYVWHYIPCKQIKQFYLLFSMIKYCKTPSVQVRMARQDLQDHETTCWAFWKPDIAFLPPLVSPHKTSAELSSADVVRIVSSIRENYFPGFAIASCNLQMQMRHPLKNFKHLWAFLIVICICICICNGNCICKFICIPTFVNIQIPILQPSQNCGGMILVHQ